MAAAIESDVRRFIGENFLFGDAGVQLGADDSLLGSGVIDSTGVLELVGFLEQRFAISVEDKELIPENLDSISRITAYVTRKTAG